MIKGLRRRGTRMLLIAMAMLAGASGIALATIPGSTGVISGCYEKRIGILRVIDAEAGKKCTTYETPISWNQNGQDGAPGLPGADGKDGAPGAPGADGKDGQDGVSVTSEPLAAGDSNCANGGSKFTAASGVTYACNGLTTTSIPEGKVVIVSQLRHAAGFSGNWAALEPSPPSGETVLVWARITGVRPSVTPSMSIRCFVAAGGTEYAATPWLTGTATQPATIEIGNVDAFPAGGASILLPAVAEVTLRCESDSPAHFHYDQLSFFALAPK
jgi:hypothetical protein